MRTTNLKVMGLMSLVALATGCGQSPYHQGVDPTGTIPNTTTGGTIPTTTGTTTTTTPPSGTTTTNVGTQNYAYTAEVTGHGTWISPPIGTDSIFKVTVTAGNSLGLTGTGYTVGYNCQILKVTVLGQTATAFVKRVGYQPPPWADPCSAAQESVTLDFSGRLAQGHHTVNVTVSQVQYDNCRLWYGRTDLGGCTMSMVYQSHTVNANLEVIVNSLPAGGA